MEAHHPKQLVTFVRATAVLALPAPHQEAWLASLDVHAPVDELALEFDDGHHLLAQWVDAGWLPQAAVPAFSALDAALSDMSGPRNAHLWTIDGLYRAPEWERIRDLAALVIREL